MLFQQVIYKKRGSMMGLANPIICCLCLCLFISVAEAQVSQLSPLLKPSKNSSPNVHKDTLSAIKEMLGQKIIVDFRYFCEDDTPSTRCRAPMTEVPRPVLELLSANNIGGVILFSENIQSAEQLIRLNYTMQQQMVSKGRQPLFIAVDQEGGKVARLPPQLLTPFAGNMAIGATFQQRGNAFSKNVASHIGKVLLPLGINTNFAPSVDVNSEPKNPVINIRSFSENPEHVAALGQGFVEAMQSTGVISAIKHFPGHGDTQVDSHTGLPLVTHTKAQAMVGDILPFANIINSQTPPAMVMSAHIQYPSLDDTVIVDKHETPQVIPATLSKKILTNLLREQLGYKGLIVSDALDMAGISQFFSPEEALLRAYSAGVDIALMPFTIRNHADINAFEMFINDVATTIAKRSLETSDSSFLPSFEVPESAFLEASFNRIINTKQRFNLQKFVSKPISWWFNEVKEYSLTENANSLKNKGIQIEKGLSSSSVSILFGEEQLPVTRTRWLALMPDTARCLALESALIQSIQDAGKKPIEFACLPLTALPEPQLALDLLQHADTLLVGNISPLHANYELGGFDLQEHVKKRASEKDIITFSKKIMRAANAQNKTVIFAPLRMPYKVNEVKEFTDIAIATFSYAIRVNKTGTQDVGTVTSFSLNALTDVLVGNTVAEGRSPVSIN